MRWVSLIHPMLASFLSRTFSYTSHADFIFIAGVYLTHPVVALLLFLLLSREFPVLASFLSWGFLLHIPCWRHFYLGSFSYTSLPGFTFLWGVSLTRPMLASFLFNLGSFSYTSSAGLVFIWGVSLKHPIPVSIVFGEFLLHIPCWLSFYAGMFSHTPHVAFIIMRGVCLTHPVLISFFIGEVSLTQPVPASFLSGQFLLHIPCWLYIYVGSFSYTSHAGFFFF